MHRQHVLPGQAQQGRVEEREEKEHRRPAALERQVPIVPTEEGTWAKRKQGNGIKESRDGA